MKDYTIVEVLEDKMLIQPKTYTVGDVGVPHLKISFKYLFGETTLNGTKLQVRYDLPKGFIMDEYTLEKEEIEFPVNPKTFYNPGWIKIFLVLKKDADTSITIPGEISLRVRNVNISNEEVEPVYDVLIGKIDDHVEQIVAGAVGVSLTTKTEPIPGGRIPDNDLSAKKLMVSSDEDKIKMAHLSTEVKATIQSDPIPASRIPNNEIPASKLRTASDADKVKLINLSDEVIRAMSGNSPVRPEIGTGEVVSEKIADKAVIRDKRSPAGVQAYISTISPVMIDNTNKTVTIPKASRISLEKNIITNDVSDTVLSFRDALLESTSNVYIACVVNTLGEFRFIRDGGFMRNLPENELPVLTLVVRGVPGKVVSCITTCDVLLDGYPQDRKNRYLEALTNTKNLLNSQGATISKDKVEILDNLSNEFKVSGGGYYIVTIPAASDITNISASLEVSSYSPFSIFRARFKSGASIVKQPTLNKISNASSLYVLENEPNVEGVEYLELIIDMRQAPESEYVVIKNPKLVSGSFIDLNESSGTYELLNKYKDYTLTEVSSEVNSPSFARKTLAKVFNLFLGSDLNDLSHFDFRLGTSSVDIVENNKKKLLRLKPTQDGNKYRFGFYLNKITYNTEYIFEYLLAERVYNSTGIAPIDNGITVHFFDENSQELSRISEPLCGVGLNATLKFNTSDLRVKKIGIAFNVTSDKNNVNTDFYTVTELGVFSNSFEGKLIDETLMEERLSRENPFFAYPLGRNYVFHSKDLSLDEIKSHRDEFKRDLGAYNVLKQGNIYTLSPTGASYFFYYLNTILDLGAGSRVSVALRVLKDNPKFLKTLRFMNGDTSIGSQIPLKENYSFKGWWYIEDVEVPESATHVEIRLDYRGSGITEAVEFDNLVFQNSKKLTPYQESPRNESVVKFVSPNGSDSQGIGTRVAPYKTFKKALAVGATKILATRGTYYEGNITKVGGTLEIMPADDNRNWTPDAPNTPKINILNAEPLTLIGTEDALSVFFVVETKLLKDVFVDKTENPIIGGNRPTYYVSVWGCYEDPYKKDYRYKPVLSKAECISESGSFFYEDGKIWINLIDNAKQYYLSGEGSVIGLSSLDSLTLQDVDFKFSKETSAILTNIKDCKIHNCSASHSLKGNGFVLDNTNANLYSCKASHNNNDGFNIHHYGDTNFYNCSGYYNWDDGISHHDGCTGSILGGEWYGNGKAGIIPSYGSIVEVHNTYCHDNLNYGIAYISSYDYPKRTVRASNNISERNQRGFAIGIGYECIFTNCIATENTIVGFEGSSDGVMFLNLCTANGNQNGVSYAGSSSGHLVNCKSINNSVSGLVSASTRDITMSSNLIMDNLGTGVKNTGSGTIKTKYKNNVIGNSPDYSGISDEDKNKNIAVSQI